MGVEKVNFGATLRQEGIKKAFFRVDFFLYRWGFESSPRCTQNWLFFCDPSDETTEARFGAASFFVPENFVFAQKNRPGRASLMAGHPPSRASCACGVVASTPPHGYVPARRFAPCGPGGRGLGVPRRDAAPDRRMGKERPGKAPLFRRTRRDAPRKGKMRVEADPLRPGRLSPDRGRRPQPASGMPEVLPEEEGLPAGRRCRAPPGNGETPRGSGGAEAQPKRSPKPEGRRLDAPSALSTGWIYDDREK